MKPVVVTYPLGDDPPEAKLFYGAHVVETLRQLSSASVHMVATSPPYWGLRDYGVEGQIGAEASPSEYVANLVTVFQSPSPNRMETNPIS